MLKIHHLFLRSFAVIFLCILAAFIVVTYFWSKNIYIEQVEKNLTQSVNTFSVLLNNLNDIDTVVKKLRQKTNTRITIIDSSGKVIAESDKNKKFLENHLNREEIKQARKFGKGSSIRFSKTLQKDLLYVAKKTTINDKTYYLRMADFIDKIFDNFVNLSLKIFAWMSLFLIFAFLATYFIGIKIKKETDNILEFLNNLSNKTKNDKINSRYTKEFYDITKLLNKVSFKLAKRNKQKAKQTAKLKLANRQKDEIISAISHEFKNPIAVITGYSETILNDKQLPDNMKQRFLNKILSNSVKMTNLIDKLRLTLKLEEGKQELSVLPTSLKKIVQDSISDLKEKYKNAEVEVLGDDVILKVDETLFSLCITNLIENALKYSEDKVIVKIDKKSLCVIDNGIGIKDSELELIKQKFYRVSRNGWDNSLGLGLFIVYSIISLHNFKLKVESEINKGSNFCIKF